MKPVYKIPDVYLKGAAVKAAMSEIPRLHMRTMLGDKPNALENIGITVLKALQEYHGDLPDGETNTPARVNQGCTYGSSIHRKRTGETG